MRHNPCGEYQYIANLMCHLSKFHIIWPQKTKTGKEVAACLKRYEFCYFGIPDVFQSDNGLEFKNVIVQDLINRWKGDCKVVYGRPRNTQSQGYIQIQLFFIDVIIIVIFIYK